MLRTRIIAALIAIPIVFVGVYVGNLAFFIGAIVVALIAGWEFGQMMKAGGYHTSPLFTLGLAVLLIIDSYYYWPQSQTQTIISLIFLGSLIWQLFQHSKHPTADWALTLGGGFYIGWGIAHLVGLRQLTDGIIWVLVAFFCTWGADILAYFIGRQFGRHKLWPRHSPGKTIEGAVGGVVGGMVGAVLIWVIFPDTVNLPSMLFIGAVVPLFAMFGDLVESMMKRDTGIKDSSNLFPGHGGFLDRIDSLLFVSIVVYYYALWIG